jgi:transcription elongation factor GreA
LGHASIIKNASGDSVSLGSQVTVLTNDNKEITFTIVGEYEADPHKKKISHDSPLGKALFGKKVSDQVEYDAPVGRIIYKVKKVH